MINPKADNNEEIEPERQSGDQLHPPSEPLKSGVNTPAVQGWPSHHRGALPPQGPKQDDRRVVMKQNLLRTHAFRQKTVDGRVRFTPEDQPAFENSKPLAHHDILVVAPKGVHKDDEYYRIPVRKREAPGEKAGTYDQPPELMDPYDIGQRKVNSFARPQDWGTPSHRDEPRGPAFATLPVKPEPGASSCVVCYLINAQNLNYQNAWTAEEWADPGGDDLEAAPGADAEEFEALLAGPRGKVFRVKIAKAEAWSLGKSEAFSDGRGEIECVDLSGQMEIWNQLRSGCVAGRAMFEDAAGSRVIPLVNITTLTPNGVAPGQKGNHS